MSSQEPDPRQETPEQRDDRNLAELLQELRVAGLGVQVLFGFLLSIPFSTKFSRLSLAQRDLYITTLLLAALATALLLAPVAYHRLVFRRREKERLVRAANVLAILGLAVVGLAVTSAVALIVSYVAPGMPTVLISIIVFCMFAGLWFAFPLARRQ
jgi:putative flippase GtrA